MKTGFLLAVVVAVSAVAVAIGISVAQAAPPSTATQNRADTASSSVHSFLARSSAPAMPQQNYALTELPTTPGGRPPGATEYATRWRLDNVAGDNVVMTVWGPGSGCTTLNYVAVSQTPEAVTIAAYEYVVQKSGIACTAALKSETGVIRLSQPLGKRALLHSPLPPTPAPIG